MSADAKLVRDRIPEIIRATGAEPITYRAEPYEYRLRLREKLAEEVGEFLAADDENAIEVVYALAADLGTDKAQLEQVREDKASQRGGFAERIVWTGLR